MTDNVDLELAELLRKQVPHDESIHSTLLRTLLAYDPNIKPTGVIDNSGCWTGNPYVQKQYQFLFYRNPDHVLLETIDTGVSVDGEYNCLFDNPAYYTYRIDSTFFGGRRARAPSSKIRYCLPCIEESIDSVGYGYFRHFWNRSDLCLIHGQTLKVLPELGFAKTLKAVKLLFNAKDSGQAISLAKMPKVAAKYPSKRTWDKTGRYVFPIKFAPGCLMSAFAHWVNSNFSKFKNITLQDFARRVTGQYLKRYHLYTFDYRREFAGIFMLCAEYEPELLHSFMVNEVSLIGLELGPRKQGVLREIFAKHSTINCSTCKEKSCIMKAHQGTFSVDINGLTLKNLFESSYTLTRICMQDRPIKISNNSIWGAIDVSPEITNSKASEAIEFTLNQVCYK